MKKHRMLKRIMVFFMSFTIFLSLMGAAFTSAYATTNTAVTGTTVITTAAQLDTIVRKNLSGNYKLGNDIDLTNYTSSTNSAAKGWTALACFTGVFDGNGHTIKGLWSRDLGSNQGLFGWIKGGTVKNLTIVLDGKGITGAGERKGGLAGNVYDGAMVDNVHIVGAENGSAVEGSANYIAGLAGVVYKSTVKNASVTNVKLLGGSYVAGLAGVIYYQSEVSCSEAKKVSVYAKASYAGGFAGAIYDKSPVVSDCSVFDATVTAQGPVAGGFTAIAYDTATLKSCFVDKIAVKAYAYAGGFAGQIHGSAKVSASCAQNGTAQTTVTYIAGGFVGEFAYNGSITDCYAQIDVTAKTSCAGGFVGYYSGAGSKKFIKNTYAAGMVKAVANSNYGAYAGFSDVSTSRYDGTNYYDNKINPGLPASGSSNNGSGIGRPVGYCTQEMKQQKTFKGWDFNSIWRIDENRTYPYFEFNTCLADITISFDKNASDATGTMANQGFKKDIPAVLNGNQFSRPGYNFIGWSITPAGSAIYTDGQTASFSTCTTLYAVWTPVAVNITVRFVKNEAGATGTMSLQTMQQNTPTALLKNEFEHIDFVFLGWSKSPAGNVEYTDTATVSFSQNTTLYAVWGAPDLYGNMVGDRDSAFVGEIIKYTVTLGNQNTHNSTPLYGTNLEINLSEHVNYIDGSIAITQNGVPVILSNSYNPATHKLLVNIGQLDPGIEFIVNFETEILASGEGSVIYNTFTAEGNLLFTRFYSLQSKPYRKTFEENTSVTVKSSQPSMSVSSENSSASGSKRIGGSTAITVR